MKKLLLVATLIMTPLTRCDQLLDAINEHDLKKVTVLLLQKEYDLTNYEQYITAAHKVVEQCEYAMKTHAIEPSALQKMIVASCTAASIYPIYTFIKTHAECRLDEINCTDLILPVAQFIGFYMIASFVITIPMVLPFILLCTNHQEAINVEKLLLEHRLG